MISDIFSIIANKIMNALFKYIGYFFSLQLVLFQEKKYTKTTVFRIFFFRVGIFLEEKLVFFN